jgi:hypothetical protein
LSYSLIHWFIPLAENLIVTTLVLLGFGSAIIIADVEEVASGRDHWWSIVDVTLGAIVSVASH